MKPWIITLALAIFLLPLKGYAAVCEFAQGHHQTTLNMDIPAALSIPRDTPNGTVIYESPQIVLGPTPSSFKCTTISPYGVQNDAGPTNPSLNYMLIGTTGLAWQWGRVGRIEAIYPKNSKPAGTYGWDNTGHRLILLKVADINDLQRVPAGVLGHYQLDGVSPLSISTRGMAIFPQSCETPDVRVDMGSSDLSIFSEYGKHSNPVQFNIKLNNCPHYISKVVYNLKPTNGSVISAAHGIVELSKDSTAQGISLQILDESQEPIELNKTHIFHGYSADGGNFSIPLAAQYVRTLPTGKKGEFDPGMSPGSANANIWFIMSYL